MYTIISTWDPNSLMKVIQGFPGSGKSTAAMDIITKLRK
jgi:nucleoside-triphosphatase THEP1